MMSAKLLVVSLTLVVIGITGADCYKAQTQSDAPVVNPSPASNIEVKPNTSTDNNNVDSNSNTENLTRKWDYSELHKSPYQTKPRRKQIKYPNDCESKAEYVLETVCRETLENIISELPKEGCSYEAFQPELHRFREEVKGYLGLLSYTVQETDADGIEAIAKRLGTVPDNIIRNSKLQKPVKLVVGQELKYEKAELREYITNWLEENSNIEFYPLSANKYLLEVRCWASAYNLSNVYLLYDESAIPAKTKVLEFPDLDFSFDKNDKEDEYPVSFEKIMVKSVPGRIFNPKTKELITLDKKTGIGYAGRYARYSFPNGEPKLEEYRAKFKEDGNGLGDDWLKTVLTTWKRYYPK